jgi:predicted nucleotidyltransferase
MKPTAGLRPTDDQQLLIRKMLTNLLGKIDFDRLCLGIEVGGINKDVLQIFVQEHCAVEIKLHYSDDFAAAAEYALGAPVRMVKVVPVDIAVAAIERPVDSHAG